MSEPPLPDVPAWINVSRETVQRLGRFVAVLDRWQRTHNLIAPADAATIWTRHVFDSAQLHPLFPMAKRWMDLGSGAGFPGIVIAILIAGMEGAQVDLVESDQTKGAFLRAAIRETSAAAVVHSSRIEAHIAGWTDPVEIVTARALAPLTKLCELAKPLVDRGAVAAFHKGRDFERELDEASLHWTLDLVKHPSRIGDGVILEIRGMERRARP